MSFFQGLAGGLSQGVQLHGQIQNQKLQKKQAEVQSQLAQFQLDGIKDQKELERRQTGLRTLSYRTKSLRQRVANGEQVDRSELEDLKKMQIDGANNFFPELINRGAGPGEQKKLTAIEPTGDGRFAFEVGVNSPGGSRKAPMTQNRSTAPDDPLLVLSADEYLAMIDNAERSISEALVASGDNSPLISMANAQAAQQKDAAARGLIDHENKIAQDQERLKQDGRVELRNLDHQQELGLTDRRHANDLALQQSRHANDVSLKHVRSVNGPQGPKGSSFVAYSEAAGRNTRQFMDTFGNIIDSGVEDARAPSASIEKEIINRMDSSAGLSGEIDKLDGLVQAIQSGQMEGAAGRFNLGRTIREITGNKGNADSIRAKIQGLLNREVMDNLPPGVASDKDIELAMSGQVSINSSPEVLASTLEGMKKAMVTKQRYDEYMANYMANGGTLVGATQSWHQDSNELLSDVVGASGQPAQQQPISQGLGAQQQPISQPVPQQQAPIQESVQQQAPEQTLPIAGLGGQETSGNTRRIGPRTVRPPQAQNQQQPDEATIAEEQSFWDSL